MCQSVEDNSIFDQEEHLEKLLLPVHNDTKSLWLTCLFVSSVGLLGSMNIFSYQFVGKTPQDYWCTVDTLSNTSWTQNQIKEISIPKYQKNGSPEYSKCEMYQRNYDLLSTMSFDDATQYVDNYGTNKTVECSHRHFEGDVNSFVTKWDLVCDRRSLYATAQSAIQSGFIIDSFLFGYLTDRYGRRQLFLSCFGFCVFCGMAITIVPYLWLFIVLRMFLSTFSLSAINAGIVLCLEKCSVKRRSVIGPCFSLPWAIGVMILPLIAYYVRTWYYLQLAINLPFVFIFFIVWLSGIVSESPRWLILNKKYDAAYDVIKKIADSNEEELPYKEIMIKEMEKTTSQVEREAEESLGQNIVNTLNTMLSFFIRRDLRIRTVLVFFIWFASSMIYYGVGLGADVIDTNEYMYMFFSGVVEFFALLLLWPCIAYFGRRRSLLSYFLVSAISISIVAGLQYSLMESVGMLEAVNIFSYQFLGATPEKYWCDVDGLSEASWTPYQVKQLAIPVHVNNGVEEYSQCEMYKFNYSMMATMSFNEALEYAGLHAVNETEECSKRYFEGEVNSFVTKWDLVCERRSLYAAAQSAIQSGFIIDPFIFGYLTDRYGRRPLFLICYGLAILCGLALTIAPFLWIFIVLRMFISTFSLAAINSGIVLCLEMCSVKQRSIFGPWFSLQWGIGIMLLPVVAYFIKTWYFLQLTVTLPFVLLYAVIWFSGIISESPRWLILNGRYEEAYDVIKKIANTNEFQLADKNSVISLMENTSQKNETKREEKCNETLIDGCQKMSSLILRKDLRWRSILIFLIWFSPSMVYYGVGLGADVLATNEYLFIFFSGLVEFISLLCLSPITTYFGRKIALLCYFIVTGVSILTVAGLQFSLEKSELEWLRVVLYLAGKFAIAAAYQLIWVYTSELYPTNLRSLAAGGGSTVAKAGNFFSPYINDILGKKILWAPAATFGAFTLVSGSAIMFLPETYQEYLQEDTSPPDNTSQQQN